MTMRRKYDKRLEQWSKQVRDRDGNRCQITGCLNTKRLNAHHIIPEEYIETKYDLMNGITLCPSHHTFGKLSAHKNAIWFAKWMYQNKFEQYLQVTKFLNNKHIYINNEKRM